MFFRQSACNQNVIDIGVYEVDFANKLIYETLQGTCNVYNLNRISKNARWCKRDSHHSLWYINMIRRYLIVNFDEVQCRKDSSSMERRSKMLDVKDRVSIPHVDQIHTSKVSSRKQISKAFRDHM